MWLRTGQRIQIKLPSCKRALTEEETYRVWSCYNRKRRRIETEHREHKRMTMFLAITAGRPFYHNGSLYNEASVVQLSKLTQAPSLKEDLLFQEHHSNLLHLLSLFCLPVDSKCLKNQGCLLVIACNLTSDEGQSPCLSVLLSPSPSCEFVYFIHILIN